MSQGAKYRYYITYNAVTTEVFPIFPDKPVISYTNPGDQIALLKKIDTKMVFINNDNADDYTYFKNIEDTDRCALLELDVHQKCAGVYTSVATGEFGTVDGEWDIDNCTFTIEPKPSGIYACLLRPVKVNIIDIATTYTMEYLGPTSLDSVTRLRKFEDVLLYVAQQTCSDVNSIISNFFQINETTTTTIDYVTGTENRYLNLMCAALSDIRDPQPSNAATKEEVTFIEIMDDLRVFFNVFWTIDASNNIIIEHFSDYNDTVGLILTGASYTDYTNGTNKYKYIRSDSPRFEAWGMSNSQMGCEIEYDNACGNQQENTMRIDYTAKKLYTDFYTAIYDGNNLAGNSRGIFLFACYAPGVIGVAAPTSYFLMGKYNDELILSRLVQKFHRHGRPQLSGTFKFEDTHGDPTPGYSEDFFIYSSRPLKLQTEITIPFCCDDTFDSSELVTTAIGNGIVDSATHDLYGDTLKLSLKYKVASDNTDIEPDDLSGLTLWLKGDAGKTISGGKVVQWDDQSGNANHFVQPTGANAPTDGTNGIVFDVLNSQYMYSSNNIQAFPSKRGSVFIIHRIRDMVSSFSNTDKTLLATDAANKWDVSFQYTFNAGLDEWRYRSFALGTNYPAVGYVLDYQPYGWGDDGVYNNILMFELIRDGDTSQTVWHNGKRTTNSTMTIANTQPDSDSIFLGSYDGATKFFDGEIHEVIIYNRALTALERQKIEQYVSKKYNMSLYHVS